MDKVYLVLAIKNSAEVKACELFLQEDPALDRAYELADSIISTFDGNTSAWITPYPVKETLDDGTNRWLFLETSKQYVAVHLLPVNDGKLGFIKFGSTPQSVGLITAIQIQPPAAPQPHPGCTDTTKLGGILNDYIVFGSSSTALDDRYKKSSPGGFSVSGKAVNMEFLLANPRDVLPTKDLSDVQRIALVKARINHIDNYTCNWASGLSWTKDHVQLYLSSNNEFAAPVIKSECGFLDDIRDQAIHDTEDYEEESSSSSEDEW